jgi:hypothetical protein
MPGQPRTIFLTDLNRSRFDHHSLSAICSASKPANHLHCGRPILKHCISWYHLNNSQINSSALALLPLPSRPRSRSPLALVLPKHNIFAHQYMRHTGDNRYTISTNTQRATCPHLIHLCRVVCNLLICAVVP